MSLQPFNLGLESLDFLVAALHHIHEATHNLTHLGVKQYVKTYAIDQAMCFDYDLLNEAFDVNLEDRI